MIHLFRRPEIPEDHRTEVVLDKLSAAVKKFEDKVQEFHEAADQLEQEREDENGDK